jgi:hypothetical protein
MNHLDSDPAPIARIPADVDREDRLLAGLTARQIAILAGTAAGLWIAFMATRRLIPPAVFGGLAVPFALAAVMLALGQRDGVSLDRLLIAAVRQARSPRRLVPAPEGVPSAPSWVDPTTAAQARPLPAPLRLPAASISASGAIDLAEGGTAAIAAVSTVNFALRTPAEQQALVAAFGRWLNSLQHSAQILVRARRIDLSAMVAELHANAAGLPHPALERAALDHATFLASLAEDRDLLVRQVLLAVREPASGTGLRTSGSGPDRAGRRVEEAARALAAADVAVRPLDGVESTAVLAACCAPDQPQLGTGAGAPRQVITTAAEDPQVWAGVPDEPA